MFALVPPAEDHIPDGFGGKQDEYRLVCMAAAKALFQRGVELTTCTWVSSSTCVLRVMFRDDQVCTTHVVQRTCGLSVARNMGTAVPEHISCKASFAGSFCSCGKEGPSFREEKSGHENF